MDDTTNKNVKAVYDSQEAERLLEEFLPGLDLIHAEVSSQVLPPAETPITNPELDQAIAVLGLKDLQPNGCLKTKKLSDPMTREAQRVANNAAIYEVNLKRKSRPYNPALPLSNTNPQYEKIKTPEHAKLLLQHLLSAPAVGYDIETTGLRVVMGERILTHQFSSCPCQAFLIDHDMLMENKDLLHLFTQLMTDPNIVKVIHNAKFEYSFVWYSMGVDIQNMYDTMLAAFKIDENREVGLKSLAMQELKVEMIDFSEVTYGTKKYDTSYKYAVEYACADADIALQLYLKYKPITDAGGTPKELHGLPADLNYAKFFKDIDLEMPKVLAYMEHDGVLVNLALVEKYRTHNTRIIEEARQEITAIDPTVNPSSDKELRQFLYEKLKLPIVKYTKGGEPSTDKDTLDLLKHMHPIIPHLLEFSRASQFESLYLNGIPKAFNPFTCAIHTQLNQIGAKTWRFSSSDPNLQNLRKNEED